MFLIYASPLPIHSRFYELPLVTCRNGDPNKISSQDGELDARDMVLLYTETLREECIKFRYVVERKPAEPKVKGAERASAAETGKIATVEHIDAHGDERRAWKEYNRSIC